MRRRSWVSIALVLIVTGAVLPQEAGAAKRGSERITFYFGLERPEGKARAAFDAVSRPGSPSYRRFPGARQVELRYGASRPTARRLRRVARRYGFVARVDRSRVFARLTGPVRRFERVFRIRIKASFDNDVEATTWESASVRAKPRIPRDLRPLLRETVTTYARSVKPRRSGRGTASRSSARARPAQGPAPGNAGTWPGGCEAARATGSYAPAQVRAAYGLSALGTGANGSAAIVNVGESPIASDVRAIAACFGLPALKRKLLLTDGQSKAFNPGSPEPQEDLTLVQGMAPGIRSVTLAQVWLATDLWFLGASEVLAMPARPDSLSISYGLCERDVRGRGAGPATRASADLLDALLVRLGLAGVSVFASAGDFGSTCNGDAFAGMAWPASSPYLTAVGGSRLVMNAANARVDEVVWNDLPWLSTDNGDGAGGGGLSQFSARPAWQAGLPVPGARRAAPDVAAHASTLPGWPVVFGGNWLEDGGTSASAPLVAGAFAALSANERAAGRPPLGPVNGLLYSLSRTRPDALFDIVSGNNGYSAKVPARNAAPGYDLASGLGVPRFDVIAASLPAPAR